MDQLGAAQSESEPKTLRLRGQTFDVPATLSWRVAWLLGRGETEKALRHILGEAYESFAATADVEDVTAFLEGLDGPYPRPGALEVLAGLGQLLAEFYEALEADLLSHYRLELPELLETDVSCRRLWVLIAGLPADGAFQRALSATNPSAPPQGPEEPPLVVLAPDDPDAFLASLTTFAREAK